ncbi:MAG: hypothetical protein GYA59_02915 [Chloroflexi bacterium]|nr:hypothetical protein [Chloroflexota bacterium]
MMINKKIRITAGASKVKAYADSDGSFFRLRENILKGFGFLAKAVLPRVDPESDESTINYPFPKTEIWQRYW